MESIFSLPSELMITSISTQFPCREQQIRSLATLLSIQSAPSRNIVLHGLEATGKTAVTKFLLAGLSNPDETNDTELRHTVIKSIECITGRHLLEQTIGAIAKSVEYTGALGRCENLAQLAVDTAKVLEDWTAGRRKRFVLVFDGIDRQRDAPPTLLPALARLSEIIPNLTTIFIVTTSPPNFLHTPGAPHIHFPSYTKPELLHILSQMNPSPTLPTGERDTQEVWTRFTTAVYDSLSKHSGRDILSFRSVCLRLWPRFIRPILDGTHYATPFSRLLLANRSLLQNEGILIPSLTNSTTQTPGLPKPTTGIHTQLPYFTRLLLISAYLASHNPPRMDSILFTKTALSARRKKGGGTALSRKPGVSTSRKISRKLLGPQTFVLERMLAIFHAVRGDADEKFRVSRKWRILAASSQNGTNAKRKKGQGLGVGVAGSADLQMAISTLCSLKLINRVGGAGGDPLDSAGKLRVNVGWEVVRNIGRSVGVEVEDWVYE